MPTHLTLKGHRLFQMAVVFSLFSAILSCTVAFSEEEEETFTVRMEGRADGTGFAARRQAIINAQEQIISEVLKALAPDTDEKYFRPILQNASSFIGNYQVLRFDQYGHYVRVEIDAEVREDALQKDVATIMLPRMPKAPSILLYMSEQLPNEEMAIGGGTNASQALLQHLEQQGLEVGVAEALSSHYSKEDLLKACDGDITTASQYARTSLKDVVIFGKADALVQENTLDSNVNRHHAKVSVHVFRGVDGKKIDAFQVSAAVLAVVPKEGAEQAIRDACGKLTYELTTAAVIAALGAATRPYVILSVENSGTRERFDELVNVLRLEANVKTVEVLFYTPELARIKAVYSGAMVQLRDYLDLYTYAGKILELRRSIERDMTLRFLD